MRKIITVMILILGSFVSNAQDTTKFKVLPIEIDSSLPAKVDTAAMMDTAKMYIDSAIIYNDSAKIEMFMARLYAIMARDQISYKWTKRYVKLNNRHYHKSTEFQNLAEMYMFRARIYAIKPEP